MDEPFQVQQYYTSKRVCKKYRAKNRRTDSVGSKSYLTPKVGPVLKIFNYEVTPYFLYFYRANVQMSTPFFEIDPEIRHTYSVNPCQPVTERGVCFVQFFRQIFSFLHFIGIFGSQDIPKIRRTKITKTHLSTGWKLIIEHACHISGSYIRKRRGHLDICGVELDVFGLKVPKKMALPRTYLVSEWDILKTVVMKFVYTLGVKFGLMLIPRSQFFE